MSGSEQQFYVSIKVYTQFSFKWDLPKAPFKDLIKLCEKFGFACEGEDYEKHHDLHSTEERDHRKRIEVMHICGYSEIQKFTDLIMGYCWYSGFISDPIEVYLRSPRRE